MSATDVPKVWEVTKEFPDGHARPMTDAEVAQLQTDRAAFAAEAQAAAKAVADRQALVAKLKTGTATPAEIQTILAQLLGG